MMNNNEPVYICRCEEVTREEIEAAIKNGASTLAGVKKRTHAGMGLCQGASCRRLISALLAQHHNCPPTYTPTIRPPVRPVRIGDIVGGDEP